MNSNHYSYFSDKSDIYASSRPHYPAELFNYLASISPGRSLAWDCGCGNGQAAVSLAEHFDNVEASDVSAEQIAQAKLRANIHYSVSPAEACSFKDSSIDLITVAQALHWFDLERYWKEVKRVLKPRGVFAAFGYSWFSVDSESDELFKKYILDEIHDFWAPQNRLLWNHYREVDFPFDNIDVPPFALRLNWNLYELFGYVHSWSATRRCMEQRGDDFFRHAFEKLSIIWGDPAAARNVEMDFCFIARRKS